MIDSRIRCGTAGEFDEDLTSAMGFLGSAPAVVHAAAAAMAHQQAAGRPQQSRLAR
jgi:hypothetical protein